MPPGGDEARRTSVTLIFLFVVLFVLLGFLSTVLVVQRQLPEVVLARVLIIAAVILLAALVINWRMRPAAASEPGVHQGDER